MKYIIVKLICLIGVTATGYITIGGYFYSYIEDSASYYTLDIPSDFVSYEIIEPGGGEPGKTIIYKYRDSSIIYISESGMNEPNTPNYLNIINLQDSLSMLHLQHKKIILEINERIGSDKLIVRGDTSIVSGINNDSLFWKEYMIHEVSCGYMNVTKEKRRVYDKCLKTFKQKKIM